MQDQERWLAAVDVVDRVGQGDRVGVVQGGAAGAQPGVQRERVARLRPVLPGDWVEVGGDAARPADSSDGEPQRGLPMRGQRGEVLVQVGHLGQAPPGGHAAQQGLLGALDLLGGGQRGGQPLGW